MYLKSDELDGFSLHPNEPQLETTGAARRAGPAPGVRETSG
jgi:hypothetical protein